MKERTDAKSHWENVWEKRHWLRMIGLVLTLLLVLSACRQEVSVPEEDTVGESPAAAEEETGEAVPTVGDVEIVEEVPAAEEEAVEEVTETGPQRGGQLTIAVSGGIETIDPHLRSGLTTQLEVIANTYSQPVSYELVPNEAGTGGVVDNNTLVPLMAESIELSEDKTTLTVRMPEGLTFHNGDPVDKEAWEWNWDRIYDTGAVTQVLLELGAAGSRNSVEVLDDRTFTITAEEPNELFALVYGTNSSGLVNPLQVMENATEDDPWGTEWLRTHEAGNGPFVLESLTSEEIILSRWDDYFHPEQPYLDRIVYRIIPDPTARVALLQSGDVDVAYELPLESIPALEADPNVNIFAVPSTEVTFIVMNNSIPPFDDPLVRQAINHAIPVDEIIESVTTGYAQRMTSYVPQGTPGHIDVAYEYDPEKARELLAEAGFSDGFSTEFHIISGRAEAEQIAIWVRSALQEIGVEVEITTLPSAAYFEQRRLRQLPFYLQADWTTTTNDALNHLNWLVRSECCNYADYQNTEVWDIIEQYFLWTDEDERLAAIEEAQRILAEDAAWVPLYQPDYILAVRKEIAGIYPDPITGQNRFWTWYRTDLE